MPSLLSANNYHHIRGGSDALYFAQAGLFRDRGWDNTFFSMRHPKNEPCETEEYFAEQIDYDMGASLGRTLLNSARIIYSLDAKKKLSALLDHFPIDVAHFHCIFHHLSPSVLVETTRRGIPTVLTAHELKLACPAYKMMNSGGVCEKCKGGKVWNVAMNSCIKNSAAASALIMLESATHKALNIYARHLNKVITPSQFYRNKLIEWGWDPELLVYVPNFIDLNKHKIENTKRSDYILYFGRLAPEKGLKTLIRASALSGVKTKIVGTGQNEVELKRLAASLDAPVEFLGYRSGEDLWSIVDGAKAVVLPSEWYENGPMSVIEAFARGRPLIGADIGGIPELIEEGETGWLFQSGNVGELAGALQIASTRTDAQLNDIAQNTRCFVEGNFTSDKYFERIMEVYRSIGVPVSA